MYEGKHERYMLAFPIIGAILFFMIAFKSNEGFDIMASMLGSALAIISILMGWEFDEKEKTERQHYIQRDDK